MGKRPGTMEPVALALEILRRIPARHPITVAELHDQLSAAGFERDIRTIQRQLEMLREHFDIVCLDQNKPYGYHWKEGARGMPLQTLGPSESLILALAERQLQPLLPRSLKLSMASLFEQARRNLDPTTPAELDRQWLKKVRIVSTTQPLLPPKIQNGVFEAVSDALYRNRWLHVQYKNSTGKRSKSDVMPLGLALQGARLYLVCRFQGFQNERNLALHRITSARASDLSFERPNDFNLDAYDGEGRFHIGDGRRVKLSFSISTEAGKHLTESHLSTDQTIETVGDGYRISATVVDSKLLDHWLQGFGDEVWEIAKCET